MSRIAQPDEIAKFKGAHKKDPQRYKKVVPKSDLPLGTYPDHMTANAKKVWFELEALAIKGVLTGADRWIMEITSELMAEFRENQRAFPTARFGQLVSCMARLGMTPSDRKKLGADKPPDENPFNKYV